MNMFAGMLGGWEIAGILLIVLILFGAKKMPALAKGFAESIKEFRKVTEDVKDELDNAKNL